MSKDRRVPSERVKTSDTAQQSLLLDVEALVAAFLGDAPIAELVPIVDRLAAAADHWGEIPAPAIAELRSAVELMRGGHACATVSALLAARSELSKPPR
jgi:hypothetical protein